MTLEEIESKNATFAAKTYWVLVEILKVLQQQPVSVVVNAVDSKSLMEHSGEILDAIHHELNKGYHPIQEHFRREHRLIGGKE